MTRGPDLLIAGGGPAGLATAIHAAAAGLEAVVIEPRPGVIDKACGEGLMPGGLRELEALGIGPPPGRPFFGIRYVEGALSAEGRFPRGEHGLGVRRTTLHAALLARAQALSVRIVEGRVDEVRQDADGVAAGGLRARWLVAADGLHSPIRRRLGLELPPRAPPRFGVRRHFAAAPWSDLVEVHLAPDAEAYVAPVAEDLVGIALLFSEKARWEALFARFPALCERALDPLGPPSGAGPFEQRVRTRVAGRVLLVGDAAGFLDPLTGEGIRLGLAAARALVRAIRAGAPGSYERAWRGLTRRYRLLTSALLWVRRTPALRARMVPLLRRLPRLFDAALALLSEGPIGGGERGGARARSLRSLHGRALYTGSRC